MTIAIALSLIGLVFIFLEFFLPGGILAILGGLAVCAGDVLILLGEQPVVFKTIYVFITSLLIIIAIKTAIWVIKNRQKNNYLLETDQSEFTASELDTALIGKAGEAASDLKPSGYIMVNEKRVQAVSESDYIGKGKKIIIIGGRGAYYIVKEER